MVAMVMMDMVLMVLMMTMVVMMVMMDMVVTVVMMVMVVAGQAGQTGETKLTFELDFPGNLRLAAFAILVMFSTSPLFPTVTFTIFVYPNSSPPNNGYLRKYYFYLKFLLKISPLKCIFSLLLLNNHPARAGIRSKPPFGLETRPTRRNAGWRQKVGNKKLIVSLLGSRIPPVSPLCQPSWISPPTL